MAQSISTRLKNSVLIDTGVENYEALLEDVQANFATTNVTIKLIDSSVDGVAEITRILSESSQTTQWSAVHIVSHGEPGQIQLGDVSLGSDTIDDYAGQIASWADALTADADILIYGCDLAADGDGESLVDEIANLSGADVAASDDLTGSAQLGGDWDLEYTAGFVDSDVVFSSSLIESWNHTLHTTIGDADGTSHRSIDADMEGNQVIVSSNDDSGSFQVQVSRLAADGTPLTTFDGADFVDFQVTDPATALPGDHQYAVVGSSENGDFAVGWVWNSVDGDSSKVFVKVFDAFGNLLVDQFEVGSVGKNAHNVTIAMNESGDFAVGWEEEAADPSENRLLVARYNLSGALDSLTAPVEVANGDVSGLVVGINRGGDIALAYSGPSDDTVYSYVLEGSTLSNEFVHANNTFSAISRFAVDINDEGLVGVAFEATAEIGFGFSDSPEVFSMVLDYDSGAGTWENLSPEFTLHNGFVTDVFVITGLDAGVESAPSIAIENTDTNGDTRFFVTWQGNGSWQANLDAGTVRDADGNVVSDASAFPGGDVVADSGVFISETTLFADRSYVVADEMSLQNELADFDTGARFTSINAFDDRSEYVVIFETDSDDLVSDTTLGGEPPTTSSANLIGTENNDVAFKSDFFDYNDAEGEPLKRIRIETLPANGSLSFQSVVITQADIDASSAGFVIEANEIGQLVYNVPEDTHGNNVASFEFSVSDGANWSIRPATINISLFAQEVLSASTLGQSNRGIPGDGSGVVAFRDTEISFGEDSSGSWSEILTGTGSNVDALHMVESSILAGTINPLQLQAGDFLVSTTDATSIVLDPSTNSTLSVEAGDIIRLRPTGSNGSFNGVIVASLSSIYDSVPADYNVTAITLAETDTVVGDRLITAGSILFSDSIDPSDVKLLELDEPGASSTGTVSLLIEGDDVGIDGAFSGLELIEFSTTAGGVALESGSLIASVSARERVGSDESQNIQPQDAFVLDVTTSSFYTTADASASVFYDSTDIIGNPGPAAAAFDALSLSGLQQLDEPVFPSIGANDTLEENHVKRFSPSDFANDGTENLIEHIVITKVPDQTIGSLTFEGEPVDEGRAIAADDLGLLVFEPVSNLANTPVPFEYRVSDGNSVLPPAMFQLNYTGDLDDVLVGGGTDLHAVFDEALDVSSGDLDVERDSVRTITDTDGGYTIVYRNIDVNVTETEIVAQRFDANHEQVGGEIQLFFRDGRGSLSTPAVLALDDGGFVVSTFGGGDGNRELLITRYDNSGNRVDWQTGTPVTNSQVVSFANVNDSENSVSLTQLETGELVIVHIDDSLGDEFVKANIVRSDGTVTEIDVTEAGGVLRDASVAALNEGGFVVAYTLGGGDDGVIRVNAYDVNGFPDGFSSEVVLGQSARNDIGDAPSITVLPNNRIVLVWNQDQTNDERDPNNIVAVVLNPDGSVLPPGQVTLATTDSDDFSPDVVALSDGGFLITVNDGSQADGVIEARRYDADFNQIGSLEFPVSGVTGDKTGPSLITLPDTGEVVAAWASNDLGSGDTVEANVFLPESFAPAGERIVLNLTAGIAPGAQEQIDGSTISELPLGTRVFGDDLSDPNRNQIELSGGPSFDLSGVDLGSVEIELPTGVTEAIYSLDVRFNDPSGNDEISQRLLARTEASLHSISVTIFNDDNADGLIASEGIFAGVDVKLYRENADETIVLVDDQTTDADGNYEFTNLDNGTYFVAVDSRTIGSSEVANAGDLGRIWAEQTYGSAGSIVGDLDSIAQPAGFLFGGRNADVSDNASSLATSEHVNRQVLSASSVGPTNVDFGFSFDVVVNTEDRFEFDGRAAQGSLRQFINNANNVIGPNQMRFVPVDPANASTDLDNDTETLEEFWRIDLITELPSITSSFTTIDGQAYRPTGSGLDELDRNAFAVGNSFSAAVGTDGVTFEQTDAPELEIVSQFALSQYFSINADAGNPGITDIEISNLAIDGSGSNAIRVTGAVSNGTSNLSNITISNNVIGSSPNDLSTGIDALAGAFNRGIFVAGVSDGLIFNNVIAGSGGSGIQLDGAVSNFTISQNEILNNGQFDANGDGIESFNTTDIIVRENVIHGNSGNGIDEIATIDGSGNFTISDNSIYNNGVSVDSNNREGSGIRLFGDGSTVTSNDIYDNENDGITVVGFVDQGRLITGSENLISQNRFANNGQQPIDLLTSFLNGNSFSEVDTDFSGGIEEDEAEGVVDGDFFAIANSITSDNIIQGFEISDYDRVVSQEGDGENNNDGVVNPFTANEGIDPPTVNSVNVDGSDLVVELTISNPNVETVELYVVSSGNEFDYLATVDVASLADVGGDVFRATIPTSTLSASVPEGTSIAAIGIDLDNNTSEFGDSAITEVGAANAPPTASVSTAVVEEDQRLTFDASDFNVMDAETETGDLFIVIDSLVDANEGQLLLSNSPVTIGAEIALSSIDELVFVPTRDFNGMTSFLFKASDGNAQSDAVLMTVTVTSVPDAPQGQSNSSDPIEINEDEPFSSFSESTFGFLDAADANSNNGGDSFVSVRIESFTGGELTRGNGPPLDSSQTHTIMRFELPDLVFTPDLNLNGDGVASIEFTVIDSGSINNEDETARTLHFDVIPVGDSPVGIPGEVTTPEGVTLFFDASMFGFTDPIDAASNSGPDTLESVIIESFGGVGSLLFNDMPVNFGEPIPIVQIGSLRYVPENDQNGDALAVLTFRVVDDAEENSIDTTDRELTINVTAVGDSPVGTSGEATTDEDVELVFDASMFGFTDPVDNASNSGPDEFVSVIIHSFGGSGSLLFNDMPVDFGEPILVSQLENLRYIPGNATSMAMALHRSNSPWSTTVSANNEDETVRTLDLNVTAVWRQSNRYFGRSDD